MEKSMYAVLWRDKLSNVDSRTFIEAENAKEAEKLWRKSHPSRRCEFERVVW